MVKIEWRALAHHLGWLGVYGLPRWNFLGAKIIQIECNIKRVYLFLLLRCSLSSAKIIQKMIGCSFVEWLVGQESARYCCKSLRMCELWIMIFFSYGRKQAYVGILRVCHFGQSQIGQTRFKVKKVLKIVYINKIFYLYILFLDMKIYFKSRVWPKWLWPTLTPSWDSMCLTNKGVYMRG